MPHLAIFDLDKTLTREPTFERFLKQQLLKKPVRLPFALTEMGSKGALYKLNFSTRRAVKEAAIKHAIGGMPRAELEPLIDAFAENEVQNGLRLKTRSVLETYRKQGARIMIASASPELMVHAIARRLGITEVIGTKLEYDENDRLIPRLAGPNCYDIEKLRRVENAVGDSRKDLTVSMYSDHHSDIYVMRWADTATAVNATRKLRDLAHAEGMKVEDWDLADNA